VQYPATPVLLTDPPTGPISDLAYGHVGSNDVSSPSAIGTRHPAGTTVSPITSPRRTPAPPGSSAPRSPRPACSRSPRRRCGNGRFVAVGSSGAAYVSADGMTWGSSGLARSAPRRGRRALTYPEAVWHSPLGVPRPHRARPSKEPWVQKPTHGNNRSAVFPRPASLGAPPPIARSPVGFRGDRVHRHHGLPGALCQSPFPAPFRPSRSDRGSGPGRSRNRSSARCACRGFRRGRGPR